MNEQIISKAAATLNARKVYVQAFGQSHCVACHRRTLGKLCDYVIGSCGGYYANCVSLCSRCHKRMTKAQRQTGGHNDGSHSRQQPCPAQAELPE